MDVPTKLEEILQSSGRRLSKTQSARVKRIVSLVLHIVLERISYAVVREAFCQLHDCDKPGAKWNLVTNMTKFGKLLVGRLIAI